MFLPALVLFQIHGYHATLVIAVVHMCLSWVGLLAAPFLWKLAWCLWYQES